jgi:hypothetical protein
MSEILLGIAQLAVAVAGFSGLLFYFGKTDEFDITIQTRLGGLITQTSSAAMFSLLALAMYENVEEFLAVVVSSSLWIGWTGYSWIGNVSASMEAARNAGTTKALYVTWAIFCIAVLLQMLNVFCVQTIQLFIVAPIFSLALAIVLFLRILGDLRGGA